MIVLPNQPQSYSDIFKTAYKIGKATFLKILPLYILLAVLNIAIQLISTWLKGPEKENNMGLLFFAVISTLVLFYFVYALMAGIIYRLNSNIKNQDPGLNASLIFGSKKALPMLAVAILYGLSIMVGLVLFIIPGIMASIYFIFALYLIVMGYGIIGSLKESFQLVRHHWWRTAINIGLLGLAMLGIGLVVAGLVFLLMLGIGFSIGLITAAMAPNTVNLLTEPVIMVFEAFSMLIFSIFLVLLYHYSFSFMLTCIYDLQVRRQIESNKNF